MGDSIGEYYTGSLRRISREDIKSLDYSPLAVHTWMLAALPLF